MLGRSVLGRCVKNNFSFTREISASVPTFIFDRAVWSESLLGQKWVVFLRKLVLKILLRFNLNLMIVMGLFANVARALSIEL